MVCLRYFLGTWKINLIRDATSHGESPWHWKLRMTHSHQKLQNSKYQHELWNNFILIFSPIHHFWVFLLGLKRAAWRGEIQLVGSLGSPLPVETPTSFSKAWDFIRWFSKKNPLFQMGKVIDEITLSQLVFLPCVEKWLDHFHDRTHTKTPSIAMISQKHPNKEVEKYHQPRKRVLLAKE